MVAGVVSETAQLHVKPVAQTDVFEMAVASAVCTRSSSYGFVVLFDDDVGVDEREMLLLLPPFPPSPPPPPPRQFLISPIGDARF